MNMQQFWSTVPAADKLTLAQVKQQYPAAFNAFKAMDHLDPKKGQFAFTVIPNMGPGGPTTDEDEADFEERDPDQEIGDADGPSLSGAKELMWYSSEVDELHNWHPPTSAMENGGILIDQGSWLLWNY